MIIIIFKLQNAEFEFFSKIWKSHTGLLDVMFNTDLKQAGVTATVFVR